MTVRIHEVFDQLIRIFGGLEDPRLHRNMLIATGQLAGFDDLLNEPRRMWFNPRVAFPGAYE